MTEVEAELIAEMGATVYDNGYISGRVALNGGVFDISKPDEDMYLGEKIRLYIHSGLDASGDSYGYELSGDAELKVGLELIRTLKSMEAQ